MNSVSRTILCALLVTVISTAELPAEDGPLRGKLDGQVLATGSKLLLIDTDGNTLWEHRGGNCADIWMLDSGNVLFANGSVIEVNPKTNEEVFTYTPEKTKGGGAYSCQRLPNGNTLVGENAAGRITEVDASGKVVFKLDLPLTKPGNHHNLRMTRKLENGNYLVCHSGPRTVREYTPAGKVTFEVTVEKLAFSAVRLPSGNTMVGHVTGITEYTPAGKKAWEFTPADLPALSLGFLTGIHVRNNGNIAVGIYRISKKPNGAEFFEITRAKKLVWWYKAKKSPRARMNIQVLTPDGKPIPGKVLR